jgi:aminopeptidase N
MVALARGLGGALIVGLSCIGAGPAAAQASDPSPGVSLELAQARATTIGELRYELALSIPEALEEPVTGVNVLRFRLADASKPVVVDFDTPSAADVAITANGAPVSVEAMNGHLVIPAQHLRPGENAVQIRFRAGEAPLNRNADLLYTLFVPARARQALPCFDQPDLKGRWTVTLEHPAAWQSVANGEERERTPLGARVRVRFAETHPLPTYLVAFVAGRMSVETGEHLGRPMRLFHRENDGAKLARNRQALFELHARSLDALERYTGIPYPFGKFDIVLIPALQFGGMEHAGSIVYRAESLLLDESATQDQLLDRASLIAHESAHMWFGNLVTMRWFDDVWTKEVFANFMAAKVIDPLFPQVRHDLEFFLAHHGGAYGVDRTPGANPIRQPLANLDQAGSLYGPIIYQKAPVAMRQLEALLGEAAFRDGVREYLRRHAFANATWDDLIAVLARRTTVDLRHWSRMWIDEPGRPSIRTELVVGDGRVERLSLTQSDPQARGRSWPQQLRVTLGCADGRRTVVVDLVGQAVDLTRRLAGCVPDYVLAGGDGWGYGEFELDPRTQAHLLDALQRIDDPLARGVAWSALWEAMLSARLAPERLFETALQTLEVESDAQIVAEVLGDLRPLWWRFLTPQQRRAHAPAFESLLRRRLDAAPSPGLKSNWFGALRTVATTPAAVAWLHALWRRDETIPGLPLVETDETALAHALALRDIDDAASMLDAQAVRISNADRRARFAYLRGAVSGDPAERERWFRSLDTPEGRHHEVWVTEGLGLLHHPLRSASSATWVLKGLEMLPEVHRTGGLFFDSAWLQSTLNGHSSPRVAAHVRRFLDELPVGYPPRLRALLLQQTDLLLRSARAQSTASAPSSGEVD